MAQDNSDLGLIPIDNSDLGLAPVDQPKAQASSDQARPSASAPTQPSMWDKLANSGISSIMGMGLPAINKVAPHVAKTLAGINTGMITKPAQTTSDLIGGLGQGFYNLPNTVANVFGQPDLYSRRQWSRPNAPGAIGGNALAPVLATIGAAPEIEGALGVKALGEGASTAEKVIQHLIVNPFGRAASGAATAPLFGMKPQAGAALNVGFGAVPEAFGGIKNYMGRLSQAYHAIAPDLPETLAKAPKTIYQKLASGYMGLKNSASDIYKSLDQDPRINNSIPNWNNNQQSLVTNGPVKVIPNQSTTFNDQVNSILDELSNTGQTKNVLDQKAWVSGFKDKPINNFKDFMNRDKELNDLYKNENVQDNPGLAAHFARLKQALNQQADEMGSQLPEDLMPKYNQAKSLWKQAASYETLPENTDASEWYKQFKKETNPKAVAAGELDSRGFQKGNPGNFLSKTFDKSSGLADQSLKVNHLTSLLDPKDTQLAASAYLNPDALKAVPRKDLAKRLNNLNPDTKQMIFDAKTPIANSLQKVANSRVNNTLARHASGLLGMMEGAKFGHPLIGYIAGSAAPGILERKYISAPTGNALLKPEAKGVLRTRGVLPAALSTLSPNQNQNQ